MFERHDDRARRVLVLAQEEARRLNHNYIGTEHLLLGLIHEGEGVSAQALESLGITLEAVRQQLEEIIGKGQQAPSGHLPFTPRAKKVLDLSLREALHLGQNNVGTEHILLGLIREGEGVAIQLLERLGADVGLLRQEVVRLSTGAEGEVPHSAESGLPHSAEGGFVHSAEGEWFQDAEGERLHSEPSRFRLRPASWRERRVLPEVLQRVESIDAELSALKRLIGVGPEVTGLDQEIARARRDKQAAARAEDYETAAELRDRERQLLADRAASQEEWIAAHLDVSSLARGLQRLGEQVRQLLAALRFEPHDGPGPIDIEPHDGAA